MRKSLLILCLLLMASAPVDLMAADRYAVQGSAFGPQVGAFLIRWSSDLFFFNGSAADARVKLLGVSNGTLSTTSPPDIVIPRSRTTTLSANGGAVATWGPVGNPSSTVPTLWVLHLDVPDGVLMDDALFIGEDFGGSIPSPPLAQYELGKIRLPIFTALVPSNQPQVHLATFLGSTTYIPSRSNVAIYNGGGQSAQATIEIRQHCDDALLLRSTISIPSNAIIQTSGIVAPEVTCPLDFGFTPPPSSVYTVVTVDQPSFSFVSNLSNRDVPLTSISISQ